ncbi:hypothetical protein Hanom_Chr09g00762911 [Helianthus anomalus]
MYSCINHVFIYKSSIHVYTTYLCIIHISLEYPTFSSIIPVFLSTPRTQL